MESEHRDPREVRNDFAGAQVVGTVLQAGVVREIHQHFAGEPPVVVPRQLPPAPPGFVNRHEQLSVLDGLLVSAADQCHVVVLSGLGGVGKTGLGVHWAHQVSREFTGGQMYTDLGAVRHRGGVDVDDVLGGFLRSLGVRGEWIPASPQEKGALFRSIVADRRVLVMIDNVDEPAQVKPLLPASRGSMVLVTSRHRLTGLVAEGATSVGLEPLDDDEGVRLLGRMLTEVRVAQEAVAARELVRHCGGLPIALRVCGARLVGRRRRGIGRLSADLSDERRRLARLSTEGKPVVEAIFDAAYASLDGAAAGLYRGLGSHPGPEFSLEVMCVVVRGEGEAVEAAVEALLEASLLEETGEDRYRFHDLVRLHAVALADEADGAAATRRRIVDWYLGRAQAADWSIMGRRLRIAPIPEATGFADAAEALNWLEAEQANLIATVRVAMEQGWYEVVWRLVEALWAFYDNRLHHADELEVAGLGVRAARECRDLPAEAKMRHQLVRALLRANEVERAGPQARTALEVAESSGNQRVASMLIETSGFVRLAQGDHEAAVEAFERSRTINARMDNPRGVGLQSLHLGIAHRAAGRPADALAELLRAMRVMTEIGDELSQGKVGIELGETYLELGRRGEAVEALSRAVAIATSRALPRWQVRALDGLAVATSDPELAARCREAAGAVRAAGRSVTE